jgi:hypothetical protein
MRPSRSTPLLSALLAGALLAGPGCYRQYVIPVDELRKLDGFGTPPGAKSSFRYRERVLTAADGSTVAFSTGTTLRLAGPEVTGNFRYIHLTPTHFEGVLLGMEQPVLVDLSAIQFAQVEGLDPLSSLITLVATLAVGAVGFVILLSLAFAV